MISFGIFPHYFIIYCKVEFDVLSLSISVPLNILLTHFSTLGLSSKSFNSTQKIQYQI